MKKALLAIVCLLLALSPLGGGAELSATAIEPITMERVLSVFPGASRMVPVDSPVPHTVVFGGRALLGYLLYTNDIAPIPAYSGFPINSLVGLSPDGRIIDVEIIHHQEPILVIGVDDNILAAFIAQYAGMTTTERIRLTGSDQPNSIDGISGATITAMVLNRSIGEASKAVLIAHSNEEVQVSAESDGYPFWVQIWLDRKFDVALLIVGLTILVFMLLFQDWVVTKPKAFNLFRIGFLVYTVFFIGYYCLGQLSLINAMTFIRLLATDFTWDTLLLDPINFILWGFVALSIMLWGRGIFCGWLCPFGAIQELMHKLSQKLKLQQYEFPRMVHERLLAIKYVILIMLIGLSLTSIEAAAPFFEVEPFKTSISLRFQREWYFVLYPVILIALSLIVTKFYCRYICPLGALLSFSGRFMIFDWLRRRPECGSICQTCANDCSVGAIDNKGEINEMECHYCLECQTTYWDEHRCPVMVAKRERRERRAKRTERLPVQEVD